MKNFKNLLITNWHPMRWLRLGLALVFFWRMNAVDEWALGVIGLFFLYQAVFNLGCGANGCNVK